MTPADMLFALQLLQDKAVRKILVAAYFNVGHQASQSGRAARSNFVALSIYGLNVWSQFGG